MTTAGKGSVTALGAQSVMSLRDGMGKLPAALNIAALHTRLFNTPIAQPTKQSPVVRSTTAPKA